jgi:hypothetical protein
LGPLNLHVLSGNEPVELVASFVPSVASGLSFGRCVIPTSGMEEVEQAEDESEDGDDP